MALTNNNLNEADEDSGPNNQNNSVDNLVWDSQMSIATQSKQQIAIDELTRSFAREKRYTEDSSTPREYLKSVAFRIQLSRNFFIFDI
jgi:hypothetical protein